MPHVDTPQDHAFFAVMYKFATQNGVKHILTGANYSTECIRNPMEWMYFQSDSRQIRDIHRQFGERPLRNFPLTSILWHKVWLPYARGIKVLRPLNSMPYIKSEARQLLMDRFGWQPYPQKHFESRFTRFYESYWLYERFGYDVVRGHMEAHQRRRAGWVRRRRRVMIRVRVRVMLGRGRGRRRVRHDQGQRDRRRHR